MTCARPRQSRSPALASFIATMWATAQGSAEWNASAITQSGTLYPIEMMKNTKDLPVQDDFDFI